MKRRLLAPVSWVLAALAAACLCPRIAFSSSPQDPSPGIKAIKVVLDDNYPPYVFRDGDGRLHGILVDQWRLWEKKTGMRAELHAMDWGEALRRMEDGEFDVIDTIFRNEARERVFDFSKPYAAIDVPVFFHESISGISDASSLKGFPVAVKNGDAAVDYLLRRGVTRLVGYDSYEEIVRAARDRKIGVFVVDKPPAMHLLYKMGIHDQFLVSKPLYTGRFHRAVLKGNRAVLAAVEDGFARFSPEEREEIDRRWLGSPALSRESLRNVTIAISVCVVSILLLAAWNVTLRKSVERKTAELKKEVEITADQAVKLRASEENYRLLVENAGDGITIIHEGRILYVNPGASRIIGFPQGELVGRPFLDVVHAEDRERIGGYYAKRMAGEEAPSRYEFRAATASGETVWVQANVVGTMWEGKQVALSFLRDITQQKKLEEQLIQSRKMEAIGRLAGGVAHDFNNLLSVIIGYAHLLRSRPGNGAPFSKEIDEIRRAAERAAELTRQLLAFSRKQLLQPRIVSLNDIITGMTASLRRLMREDIEITSCLQGDLPPVLVDPAQVEQVILNLAVNARDAMPNGGKLVIGTKAVVVPETFVREHPNLLPGGYVELYVSDTGVGMEKGIIPKIFEPFFTTKEQGKGTGLGLASVEGIVSQSRGHVSVESEPGRGTTFRILLPEVGNEPPGAAAAPVPEGAVGGREAILLVEDDPAVLDLVRSVLDSNGYAVIAARDGAEAIRASREYRGRIRLLVTDVVMPGMDGRALSEEIRRDRPGIKVLFMSGYSADAIGRNGIIEEGVELIEKPFTPSEFAAKVRKALGA
jgi:two-component system sensor histidine kinase EvgS